MSIKKENISFYGCNLEIYLFNDRVKIKDENKENFFKFIANQDKINK